MDERSTDRCSFCGHPETYVGRLIAGSSARICDRCVEGCAVNFSGGSRWDEATRTWVDHAPLSPWPHERHSHFGDETPCSFCGKAERDLQWLVGCREPNTFICDECVGLWQTIARERGTGQPAKTSVQKSVVTRRFHWPWEAKALA